MAGTELSAAEARALLQRLGGDTRYSRRHAETGRQKLVAIRSDDGDGATREDLLPYIGQRVIVRLHPRALARIEQFDRKVALKWVHGRIGVLSDVGERRAFFDLQLRGGPPPTVDRSWDVPIKGVFSITPAPHDSARRGR